MCRFATTCTLTFLLPFAFGQNSAPLPVEVDARVETLLKHLTLEEKIDMLGGVDDLYIRGNKKISVACLKDGQRAGWSPHLWTGDYGGRHRTRGHLGPRSGAPNGRCDWAGRSRSRGSLHGGTGSQYLPYSPVPP